MKIELITRIKHPELYLRMAGSAKTTSLTPLTFTTMLDDGSPKIAETYNLLAAVSNADVFVFVHDDVIFLSDAWDQKVKDAISMGFNVMGAVGTQKYEGGLIFDSGKKYSAGKMVGTYGDKRLVKLMDNRSEIEPVQVVDGMFMAVERNHFLRNPFDYQFDGLFYYDVDFCLRSNCAVIDILLAHEKPEHLKGVYPANMKPREAYSEAFNKKHGFKSEPPIGDQRCDAMAYEDYVKEGVTV